MMEAPELSPLISTTCLSYINIVNTKQHYRKKGDRRAYLTVGPAKPPVIPSRRRTWKDILLLSVVDDDDCSIEGFLL